MEKHELGQPDFELIDEAFKALLKSNTNIDARLPASTPAAWRFRRDP